ncbi:MAG TPA: hypothetical protein VKR22_00725, partial [Acidimicrobiales bacterium]|nr:hypothetical protein [Acidimicrobiales bacterium]
VIIEPVDEHGNPVPVGIPSAKIYVTNLFNPVLPLIRYELTDQVVLLDEPCPCGSAHRRVADIQGRLDDRFEYPQGVRIHPHVFRSVLSRQPNVIEYQVTQTPSGAEISIVASGEVGSGELEGAIEAELRHAGLGVARVVVKPVERLERIASGKVRRFVPLLSANGP